MTDPLLAFVNDGYVTAADAPLLIAAVSVWWYWLMVLTLPIVRMLTGRRSGVRPQTQADRWLMRGWALLILAWNVLLGVGLHKADPPFGPFDAAYEIPLVALRWVAAGGAVLCTLLTVTCWIEMGRDWSVTIVKEQRDQRLVTTGLFRFSRHPIYSLSILLVVLSAAVCASLPLAGIALSHVVLMNIKARREEAALIESFGQEYRDYMARTGRFFPRPSRAA